MEQHERVFQISTINEKLLDLFLKDHEKKCIETNHENIFHDYMLGWLKEYLEPTEITVVPIMHSFEPENISYHQYSLVQHTNNFKSEIYIDSIPFLCYLPECKITYLQPEDSYAIIFDVSIQMPNNNLQNALIVKSIEYNYSNTLHRITNIRIDIMFNFGYSVIIEHIYYVVNDTIHIDTSHGTTECSYNIDDFVNFKNLLTTGKYGYKTIEIMFKYLLGKINYYISKIHSIKSDNN